MLNPLEDRVVLKRHEADEYKGKIVLPDSAKEKPLTADVVAVGPGRRADDGTLIVPAVSIGDAVLVGKYSGQEIKIGADELLIVRESDILGTM